jgi:mRNA interferase RelE/StbE
MYELEFSNSSNKFLKNLEKNIRERILDKIKELRKNPFPQDCKRVEGRKERVFRVRTGKIRIMYVVFQDQKKLLISNIDKRDKIYN